MLPLNHDEVVEHFAHRLVYAIDTGVSRGACVVWHSWLGWVAVHATWNGVRPTSRSSAHATVSGWSN